MAKLRRAPIPERSDSDPEQTRCEQEQAAMGTDADFRLLFVARSDARRLRCIAARRLAGLPTLEQELSSWP